MSHEKGESQDLYKTIKDVKTIVPLNASEELLIAKWKDKWKSAQVPMHLKEGEKGLQLEVSCDRGSISDKNELLTASLCQATGASDAIFAALLLQQYARVANPSDGRLITESNSHLVTMNALNPRDEVEGMLLTQILSLQTLGMSCMSRAANPDNATVHVDRNVNNLTKLLRLQHETIETLNRYRRKGTQQLVVQHVNVNQGGQAIVGAVQQSGGGVNSKNEGSTP
jgi:hypothetical protein